MSSSKAYLNEVFNLFKYIFLLLLGIDRVDKYRKHLPRITIIY